MVSLSALSPTRLLGLWTALPARVRWIVCWPLLATLYLVTFQISGIAADMLLQTILRIPWQYAHIMSPILADVMHLALVLPAIRILVPTRQHVVIFGFAAIVLLASALALHQFLADRANAAEDSWRSARDLGNCLIVLAIIGWYGVRLKLAARLNTSS